MGPAATFKVTGIKYLLSAQDMDRAVTFYRDTFGLEVIERSPWWSELRYGSAVVALHGGGKGERRPTGLSFTVDRISAACSAVESAGGEITSQPEDRGDEGIILAQFADSEGNIVMLSEVKA
ncbi:glyoxalase [Sinorhizobium meliloti]|uniref:VOC family protein n=1 Tax=Rhizobium meliloti TaxID=382 RepID=UPI000FDC3949|nr:VOC family protein [Sinorhizobium meliloti]RVH72558.1 glyoxalase [Sinorhizobium meliloti]